MDVKMTPFEKQFETESSPIQLSSVGLEILKHKIKTERQLQEFIKIVDRAVASNIEDYLSGKWISYHFGNYVFNLKKRD